MALSRITNPFLSSSGSGNASVTSPSANTIAFSTTTAERMRIDSSGVLVIGSTSYASVSGSTATTPRLQLHGTALSSSAFAQYAWNSTNTYHTFNTSGTGGLGVHAAVTTGDTLGNIQFNGSDGTSFVGGAAIKAIPEGTISTGVLPANLRFYTASAAGTLYERMRINSSGYTSIGGQLDAASLLQLYSADSTAYNGSATDGQLTAGATQLIIASAGSNTNVAQLVFQARASQPYNRIVSSGGSAPFMTFVTNNAERMRIDSSGLVTIGSTAQTKGNLNIWNAINTQTNLYIYKNTQVEAYIGFVSGASTNLYVNTGATFGTTGVYMTNLGTAWTSNSDERLKENLVPIADAISKVSTLRSVIGNFISDENKTPRPFLIAQDVQVVLPEAVSTSEIDGVEYLGVAYTEVIPLLVAAIKELKAIIDEQALKISALESK